MAAAWIGRRMGNTCSSTRDRWATRTSSAQTWKRRPPHNSPTAETTPPRPTPPTGRGSPSTRCETTTRLIYSSCAPMARTCGRSRTIPNPTGSRNGSRSSLLSPPSSAAPQRDASRRTSPELGVSYFAEPVPGQI
ncbi:MAG: hypothetical protein MZV64_23035 [Ignavibacteriales bacterium]|nr:hypothetical protein [Ignavibacteriales bacterium]